MHDVKKGVYNPDECFMSSWRRGGHITSLVTFMKQRYGVTPAEYTISTGYDDFIGAYIKFQGNHDLARMALKDVKIPIRPLAVKDVIFQPLDYILKNTKIWKFEHCHHKMGDNTSTTYKSTNVAPIYVAVLDKTYSFSFMEMYTLDI